MDNSANSGRPSDNYDYNERPGQGQTVRDSQDPWCNARADAYCRAEAPRDSRFELHIAARPGETIVVNQQHPHVRVVGIQEGGNFVVAPTQRQYEDTLRQLGYRGDASSPYFVLNEQRRAIYMPTQDYHHPVGRAPARHPRYPGYPAPGQSHEVIVRRGGVQGRDVSIDNENIYVGSGNGRGPGPGVEQEDARNHERQVMVIAGNVGLELARILTGRNGSSGGRDGYGYDRGLPRNDRRYEYQQQIRRRNGR